MKTSFCRGERLPKTAAGVLSLRFDSMFGQRAISALAGPSNRGFAIMSVRWWLLRAGRGRARNEVISFVSPKDVRYRRKRGRER